MKIKSALRKLWAVATMKQPGGEDQIPLKALLPTIVVMGTLYMMMMVGAAVGY